MLDLPELDVPLRKMTCPVRIGAEFTAPLFWRGLEEVLAVAAAEEEGEAVQVGAESVQAAGRWPMWARSDRASVAGSAVSQRAMSWSVSANGGAEAGGRRRIGRLLRVAGRNGGAESPPGPLGQTGQNGSGEDNRGGREEGGRPEIVDHDASQDY
jgi:hypothetical protein